MGELSDRFAGLMGRMARSDADLFRTIGSQNANLRQMVDELAGPDPISNPAAAPVSEAAILPAAGLLPAEACSLASLKARFGRVSDAQAWIEAQIGPAPKKPTWAVIEQTCRSGAWPLAARSSRASGAALTASQLDERLQHLEQRLEQRLDRLESLCTRLAEAIAAPQKP